MSVYSEEIADKICDGLADARSLRSICCDPDMPSQSTVFRWLGDDRYLAFREQYARAREAQADALFDEMLDIADDGTNDW
ncbi:MAG: terminase small subunit protein, partial [Oxalobacteraceae bacterium]